jgi:hypothetical protein
MADGAEGVVDSELPSDAPGPQPRSKTVVGVGKKRTDDPNKVVCRRPKGSFGMKRGSIASSVSRSDGG